MKLLIVESPNKIKKIKAYLPDDWHVSASVGHIRDLPLKELGIDRGNGYALSYLNDPEKEARVAELQAKARQVGAHNVYMGTDPDREGEAIAFHLCKVLNLDPRQTKRVTFQEITQSAITAAVASPRTVDMELVAAQESRRAVDRLVGWELSPLLQRKFGRTTPGYSAGRVQSVATRLVVEREREIKAFAGRLSFAVSAVFLTPARENLPARWTGTAPASEAEARTLLARLMAAGQYYVQHVEQKPVTQSAPPPYSTSTLQQDGVKKLKLSVAEVSDLAQKLFEQGHITYIRTDSVNLSEQARQEAAAQIQAQFGPDFTQPRTFKEKAGSQGAHEAIRPTHWDQREAGETEAQRALYRLIYTRTLASQMSNARYDQTIITLAPDLPDTAGLEFTSSARVLRFEGYRKLYQEAEEEPEEGAEAEGGRTLQQPVEEGEPLGLQQLQAQGRVQKPPKRYDEATLVAELEKRQIGRPSTYASTIATILKRQYVAAGNVTGKKFPTKTLTWTDGPLQEAPRTETVGGDKGKLLPTERGNNVTDFLLEYFPNIIDYAFTAQCEDEFDQIAEGRSTYAQMLPVFDAGLLQQKMIAEISLPPPQKAHLIGELNGLPVTSATGKFGGWVKYEETFYNLEKGVDPLLLTLDQAQAAMTAAKARKQRPVGTYQQLPIVAGINKDSKPYLIWKEEYYKLPEDCAIEALTPEVSEKYLIEAISQKEKMVFRVIDKKWTIKRGENGLYLTNGKESAGMKKVTEAEAMGWDSKAAASHFRNFQNWKAKNSATK